MKMQTYESFYDEYQVIHASTLIVGSGAAGWNAAETLAAAGQEDVVLVSASINAGTSRNSGSDKQTYYKLSLASDTPDSVAEMASDLFQGGSVDGDIAYCEAAGSVYSFMKLAKLGVKFPFNEFGEYVGYKTDHDPRQRATSSGPLTSKDMTEALERAVVNDGTVRIMDKMMVFDLIVVGGEIRGALAVDLTNPSYEQAKLVIFLSDTVILATGGTAAVYKRVVFPPSQHGMLGMAIRAGAKIQNLQEWQYGLASTTFRWNVSGTYQQVLPRYVSVDEEGVEREFLSEYLSETDELDYIFLKGYQWPFDVKKIDGSSMIDILVFHETEVLGRRVYMDFMRNPKAYRADLSNVSEETKEYLLNSGATQETPFLRLQHMNPAAIELYRNNKIDLETEMLEVAVCAQHLNGGLAVDTHWETSIKGLYCVGEAAGTFGVYRPGGSALNSGQVGSKRAAEHIAFTAKSKVTEPIDLKDHPEIRDQIESAISLLHQWALSEEDHFAGSYREEMSKSAAQIRVLSELSVIRDSLANENDADRTSGGLALSLIERDARLTQRALIESIEKAAEHFGSRGSALVFEKRPDFSELLRKPINHWGIVAEIPEGRQQVLVSSYHKEKDEFETEIRQCRPLPEPDSWFESVWARYREHFHGKKNE